MDGIRKASPIGKDEARNKYLKTLRYSPKASVIDAVEPIRPAVNQLNNQKPNLLFDVDILTRHLDNLQNAYRNLEEQKKKYKDLMRNYLKDPEFFMGLIKELVKQFNQTTACILTFDRAYQTRHSETLGDTLARQQFNFEQIGIRIVGVNQLEFDAHLFRKSVRENSDFFESQFRPAILLFEQAFVYISRIQIPTGHSQTRKTAASPVTEGTSHINQKV